MINRHRLAMLAATTAVAVLCLPARGAVERIEVIERTPFAAGMTFGEAGAYEKIRGVAYYALDPRHKANAVVVDLNHAPRDLLQRVYSAAPN